MAWGNLGLFVTACSFCSRWHTTWPTRSLCTIFTLQCFPIRHTCFYKINYLPFKRTEHVILLFVGNPFWNSPLWQICLPLWVKKWHQENILQLTQSIPVCHTPMKSFSKLPSQLQILGIKDVKEFFPGGIICFHHSLNYFPFLFCQPLNKINTALIIACNISKPLEYLLYYPGVLHARGLCCCLGYTVKDTKMPQHIGQCLKMP